MLVTGTLALLANPGTLAQTRPSLSAIANMVIQTNRVCSFSCQIVDSVIELNSFVKVMLTRNSVDNYFYVSSNYFEESEEILRARSAASLSLFSWPALDLSKVTPETMGYCQGWLGGGLWRGVLSPLRNVRFMRGLERHWAVHFPTGPNLHAFALQIIQGMGRGMIRHIDKLCQAFDCGSCARK